MQDVPTKNTGDQYTAIEYNLGTNNELKNSVEDTGIILSASDEHQLSKSISNYVAHGDFYTDSGIADAYVLSVQASKEAPTGLADGLRARFIVGYTNTGVSTVNVATLGVKSIKKYGGGTDLEAEDLIQNQIAEIIYIQSLDIFELVSIESPIVMESIPLFLNKKGLIISNNSTDADHDIDIAIGTFSDTTTNRAFTLTSSLTKQIDVNWVAGTNVGGFPSGITLTADTWYPVFAIAKADGTVDAGFDSALNASNLLADATGYIFYRRIGAVYYETGTPDAIRPFTQIGNHFLWSLPEVFSAAPVAISRTLFTILTPADIITKAHVSYGRDSENVSGGCGLVVASPFVADFAPNNNYCKDNVGIAISDAKDSAVVDDIFTDTSSQLWYRVESTTSTGTFFCDTWGWEDFVT